jgi:hypothetical protein
MRSSAPPLVLELRASRGFAAGLAIAAGGALLAVLLADLPVSIASAIGVTVVVGAARAWQGHAALAGTALRLDAEGVVAWRDAAGVEGQGQLVEHALLGPLLTLGAREPSGRRRRFALWQDMADADAWRRLRVELAHRRGADSYKP